MLLLGLFGGGSNLNLGNTSREPMPLLNAGRKITHSLSIYMIRSYSMRKGAVEIGRQ